jgi:hypothetical protein
MELWELAAREHVRDLIARYAHCADSGRFHELAMLFAEEGVLEIDGRPPLQGRLAVEAFLTRTKETLAGTGPQPYLRHHVTSIEIEVLDPDSADAVSYFFVVNESGLDHWGRYRDHFVQSGERWFFERRRVRVDAYSGRAGGG